MRPLLSAAFAAMLSCMNNSAFLCRAKWRARIIVFVLDLDDIPANGRNRRPLLDVLDNTVPAARQSAD